MTPLTPDVIERELAVRAPAWTLDDGGEYIVRRFVNRAYLDGIAFVNEVAALAEHLGHHPDLLVTYGAVEVRLTTHDAGGVTTLDLDAAVAIDRILLR